MLAWNGITIWNGGSSEHKLELDKKRKSWLRSEPVCFSTLWRMEALSASDLQVSSHPPLLVAFSTGLTGAALLGSATTLQRHLWNFPLRIKTFSCLTLYLSFCLLLLLHWYDCCLVLSGLGETGPTIYWSTYYLLCLNDWLANNMSIFQYRALKKETYICSQSTLSNGWVHRDCHR